MAHTPRRIPRLKPNRRSADRVRVRYECEQGRQFGPGGVFHIYALVGAEEFAVSVCCLGVGLVG
jgi:hypothetical protein